jgi:hypothetical protein
MKYKEVDYKKVLDNVIGIYGIKFVRELQRNHPKLSGSVIVYLYVSQFRKGIWDHYFLLRLDVYKKKIVGIIIYEGLDIIYYEGYMWDDEWKLVKIEEVLWKMN